MKVLLTNIWLDEYAGTEVYIRDLSIALNKRGHHVEVYSPKLGLVAQEIRQAGIHICDQTGDLQEVPDIIHGHQFLPTMDAIVRFQDTPVVYFVHDQSYRGDTPPHSKRITQYIAVDTICREKLLRHNIRSNQIKILFNWVDTDRFLKKQSISASAKKALVFSNNATPNNYFQRIESACQEAGIELDAVGRDFGYSVPDPENLLSKYDIVFAKGKAAIESIATGAALIVCDFRGLGGMVTPDNYSYYRANNFGKKSMIHPIDKNRILQEIKKYDAASVESVCLSIRLDADFRSYLERLIHIYQKTISTYRWKKYLMSRPYEERILRNYLQCREALE